MHAQSIAATLALTDDHQRKVCELIRRFHTGRWSIFRRMHDVQRVASELVELAEWRSGGYAVVWWSLASVALRWQDYASLAAARAAFDEVVTAAPHA